jgi:hypothetical protein
MAFPKITISKIINLILISWLLIVISYRLLICFSYKTELSNGESNNIWKIINVSNGQSFYNNPEKLPLEIFQYTPLSLVPLTGIAYFLDDNSPYFVHNISVIGRVLQLFFNLGMIYLIYKICGNFIQMDKQISFLISLISLTLLTHPAFAIRPDSMLLFCVIFTIYVYLKYLNSNNKITPIAVGLLITVCFFIKQDGILISIPLGVFLMIERKWKKLLILTAYTLTIFILSILVSSLIFGDQFLSNIIIGLNNPTSFKQLISVFERALSFFSIHITIGIVLMLFYLIKKNNTNTNTNIKLIALLSFFYFFTSITTSLKLGSWINYYTPYIIFSTILIIYYINDLLINYKNRFSKLKNIIIISLFGIISLVYNVKQIYIYTSPYLINYNFHKKQYLKARNNCENFKTNFRIKKTDSILTINPLNRMFLASNTILVNIEYYHVSNFKYLDFRKKRNKGITYIFIKKNEIISVNQLSKIFNINLNDFNNQKLNDYKVLTPKIF